MKEEYEICKSLIEDSKKNPDKYREEDVAQWADTIEWYESLDDEQVNELLRLERAEAEEFELKY